MKKRKKKDLPRGWTPKRVKGVIAHYENRSEDAQAAEDDAAFKASGHTVMVIPSEYVPAVRRLLGKKPPN